MALTKVTGSGADGLNLSSTDVTISSGDLLFATANKGVVLGVTSNTDSNTLDDYEEGTWTPVINGSSSAGSGTYSGQSGTYTKIGRTVTFNLSLVWTNHTGSGYIYIGGFPFTNGSIVTYYVVQTEQISLSSGYQAFTARIAASSTQGYLLQSPASGGDRSVISMDTTGSVNASGTYQTS